MSKNKLVEIVLKALKDAKVELKDDASEAISDALGSDALKEAGFVEVGSGSIVVKESDYNELHKDVRTEREKRKEFQTEAKRLKDVLDSGDSENRQLATRLSAENEKLKPINEKLIKRARAHWASVSAVIPAEAKADAKDEEKKRIAKIRERFVFPEKDKALEDDQVLANLDKFDELHDLGVFGEAKPAPTTTRSNVTTVPRTTGNGGPEGKTTDEAWADFLAPADSVGNAR